MNPITFTVPGNMIIKKNSQTTSYIQKNKQGKLAIRQSQDGRFAPVTYYTDAYKEWAKRCVQILMTLKTNLTAQGVQLPLTDKMNLKCLFYYDTNRKIDLSAMFEGINDCLAGNERWLNFDKKFYQIIEDDSVRFIGSFDGTRFIYEKVNPRTVVTLSDYIL